MENLTPFDSKILNKTHLSPNLMEEALEDIFRQFSFYNPSPKQEAFHKAGLEARERLFLGGNRTGKTYAVCMELAMHLTGIYPKDWKGYRFSRPISAISASISLKDTRDILQKKLFVGDIDGQTPPILHESFIVEKTHTNIAGAWDTVLIQHISGRVSELKFKAFQQGESSFQGVRADFVHLDELPNFKVYQEALVRTTSFDSEKTFLVASMWPEKGKDDMVSHFIDHAEEGKVKDGRFYIRISWDENPHMPEEEKQHLRSSLPDWQMDAREHGIPVFGQGKVFVQKESEFLVEPCFERPKHWAYVYGLDPSATSGGTWGAVLLGYDRDNDIVYVMADYKLNNATPTEHANNLKKIMPAWCTGVIDPAGAGENPHTKEKTIDFLQTKSGLRITKAIKVNGAKEAAVDEIYERIRAGTFKICWHKNVGCNHLINEWRQYARDDKGLIIKQNDHCIDALFYALAGISSARSEEQRVRELHGYREMMHRPTISGGEWMRL